SKDVAKTATQKITTLEQENNNLKTQLANAQKPLAGAGTNTGIQAGPAIIQKSKEWKAVVSFLNEPDYTKIKQYFN
ncbi:9939_t:CDS:1, partial [Gigaspora rosea]